MNCFSVCIFFLEGDDLAEEICAEDGGFAALPCEVNFGDALGLYVLLDVVFEYIGWHFPVGLLWIEFFFLEVEAVGAVEVADGSDRLCHDVKSGGCGMFVGIDGHFPGLFGAL